MNTPAPLFKSCIIACAMAATSVAQAIEIAGVNIPDDATLGGFPLVLNGTAVRSAWGIKVYAVGLFLSERKHDGAAIMTSDPMPKRVHIAMLREISKERFLTTIQGNINANFSGEERERFADEVAAFFACFDGGSSLRKGSVVKIDFLPGKGMIVSVDDTEFEPIPGDEFYHAILRLWIGNPPQRSIKDGLLGLVE